MNITAGPYNVRDDCFTMAGAVFKVRERKASPHKFLIRTQPFEYVSSLFPLAGYESYSFEFGRKWWVMEFGEGGATVAIREARPAASAASAFPEPNPFAEWIR